MVLGVLADHLGERPLRRREAAEGVVLVHLAEFGAERLGRHAVADLPAGAVVGLAEAGHHEAALGQLRITQGAFVPGAVEQDVLVDLVRKHHDVGAAHQFDQALHVGGGPQRAGGIVRRVDEDHPGARRDRRAQAIPIDREIGRIQGHVHAHSAGQVDGRLIAVVAGIEHDHFVARTHHRQHGIEDRLGRAAGDGDFRFRAGGVAVAGQGLLGDGLAQGRYARHRRILVLAVAHGARQRFDQEIGHREVRKALAEVDRLMLHRHLRHHGENGGADLRQLGLRDHQRVPG